LQVSMVSFPGPPHFLLLAVRNAGRAGTYSHVSMTNSHIEKLIFCMLFNRLYIQDLVHMKLPPTKCFSKYLLYKTAVFQFDYATLLWKYISKCGIWFLLQIWSHTSDEGDLSHQVKETGSPDSAAIGSASPIRDQIHTKLSL